MRSLTHTIQVKENGVWVDFMPAIGPRPDRAVFHVMKTTGLTARVKPVVEVPDAG